MLGFWSAAAAAAAAVQRRLVHGSQRSTNPASDHLELDDDDDVDDGGGRRLQQISCVHYTGAITWIRLLHFQVQVFFDARKKGEGEEEVKKKGIAATATAER